MGKGSHGGISRLNEKFLSQSLNVLHFMLPSYYLGICCNIMFCIACFPLFPSSQILILFLFFFTTTYTRYGWLAISFLRLWVQRTKALLGFFGFLFSVLNLTIKTTKSACDQTTIEWVLLKLCINLRKGEFQCAKIHKPFKITT